MLLLEQNSTKKKRVNKKVKKLDFDASNNSQKYEKKTFLDSAVYANEAKGHLLDLYYLIV